jgi:hypothetical protein
VKSKSALGTGGGGAPGTSHARPSRFDGRSTGSVSCHLHGCESTSATVMKRTESRNPRFFRERAEPASGPRIPPDEGSVLRTSPGGRTPANSASQLPVPQMQDFVHEKKWLNLRPEAASTAQAIQIGHAEVMRLFSSRRSHCRCSRANRRTSIASAMRMASGTSNGV